MLNRDRARGRRADGREGEHEPIPEAFDDGSTEQGRLLLDRVVMPVEQLQPRLFAECLHECGGALDVGEIGARRHYY
jgi:hypothetical protein